MNVFQRKPDPIALRERALKARIHELESQIHQLRHRIAAEQSQPKLRSTTTAHRSIQTPHVNAAPEPRFEDVDHEKVQQLEENLNDPARYNELGLRKYDPFAGLRRWLNKIKGQPKPPSPKLVNYLAAGSIHGLKPLRYEKRVARNWFLALCAFFILMLWGLIYFYFRVR